MFFQGDGGKAHATLFQSEAMCAVLDPARFTQKLLQTLEQQSKKLLRDHM